MSANFFYKGPTNKCFRLANRLRSHGVCYNYATATVLQTDDTQMDGCRMFIPIKLHRTRLWWSGGKAPIGRNGAVSGAATPWPQVNSREKFFQGFDFTETGVNILAAAWRPCMTSKTKQTTKKQAVDGFGHGLCGLPATGLETKVLITFCYN